MPDPATPKRPYRIDPQVAHNRARVAARVRNSPDTYIGQLERATLTTGQKHRLAVLLMPFLAGLPAEDGSAAGAGAR